MLKIPSIRATLGEKVIAKLKNKKDDTQRVIEFSLSRLSLTQQQLSNLVACSKHERKFAEVAFVSRDALSELRHLKKLILATEVHDAVINLDKIGSNPDPLVLTACSLKEIALSFNADERTEMACKVWAPLEEHAQYTLSAWSGQDLFVSVLSKKHGDEEPSANSDLPLGNKSANGGKP